MGLRPEAWAALKALQRSGRTRERLDNGAHVDQLRMARGMQPRYTDTRRSRKPARRARVKGEGR